MKHWCSCLLVGLLFLFIFVISSNCYASFTLTQINEYLDFAQRDPDLFLGSEGVTNLLEVRRIQETKFNEIFANGISDYGAISCTYVSNTNTYTIRIISRRISTSTISYDKITLNDKPCIRMSCDVVKWTYNGTTWDLLNQYNQTLDQYTYFMILFTSQNFTSSLKDYISELSHTELASQQQYMFALPRSSNAVYTNNNQYVTAFDCRIGQNMNIANLTANIYVLNQGSKVYQFIQKEFVQASNSDQYILNFLSADLSFDNTYYIELYYNGVLWVESEGQRIIKSVAPVPSGDSSGDSFPDLTIIGGKIDNIGNKIDHQTDMIVSGDAQIVNAINQLESGEIERNNFWKNTYNNLFAMNSGDATEVYNMIASYFPSGESPVSLYDTIFGSLNNEPDDFIIRWDAIPFNMTIGGGITTYSGDFIQSGDINFSELTRTNHTFGIVHFWVRTFAIISFLFVTYMTMYKCFMIILGVSTDFVDKSEEHRQIGFINDWRDK